MGAIFGFIQEKKEKRQKEMQQEAEIRRLRMEEQKQREREKRLAAYQEEENRKLKAAQEYCRKPAVQELLQSMMAQYTYPLPEIEWKRSNPSNDCKDPYLISTGSGLLSIDVSEKMVMCYYEWEPTRYEDWYGDHKTRLWVYSFTSNGFSNQPDVAKQEYLSYCFADLLLAGYEKKYPEYTFSRIGHSVSVRCVEKKPNTIEW